MSVEQVHGAGERARAGARIRKLRVRAVDVPMDRPVETAAGPVRSAPLALIDLETDLGVTGRSYVFSYAPFALKPLATLIGGLASAVEGERLEPLAIHDKLQMRFRLLGPQGLAGIAVSGIDMAAWDALARANGVPLAALLGGALEPVPAYGSLRSMAPAAAAEEAADAYAAGFRAMKVKLAGRDIAQELAVVRAVRQATRDDIPIMVDFNQALSVPQAVERARILEEHGLAWIEEPVRADDHRGHAAVALASKTAIQTGENLWGAYDVAASLDATASDYLMFDAMKIGGVTGWSRAATLASSRGVPVSSHIFPEFSVHLLAATPTRHWMESLDLASPILKEPLRFAEGQAAPPARPGAGLEWNEDAVLRYLVQ